MNTARSITARHIMRSSVAFVAFGAFTMAAALPANADTVPHGSAVVNIVDQSVVLDGTPQGTEGTASDNFDFQPETFLTLNADANTRVDAEGVHADITVNSAHAQLTLEDALEIIGSADTALHSSEGDVETFAEDDTVSTLDEDEYIIDVEFTDVALSITQSWDGGYDTDFEPGEITENINTLGVDIDTFSIDDEAQFDDRYSEDVVWDGAHAALFAEFDAGILGQIDFHIADASVGTADLVPDDDGDEGDDGDDGDNGDNGDDGDDGDDGDEGNEGDEGDEGGEGDKGDEDGKGDEGGEGDKGGEDGKDDDLARTGAPIAALIGAGAAIATGGGLAAYMARRKKNNATDELADETDES